MLRTEQGVHAMKKLASACASLSLIFSATPVLFSVPAQAAANPAVATCRDLLANYAEFASVNLGECVSYFTLENNVYNKGTGGIHADAMKFCKLYQKVYPADFDLLWASLDECIADNGG
jgi:hypothetical protein